MLRLKNLQRMRGKRHSPFEIVPIQRVDVYREVVERIRELIVSQVLTVGDRLPSERALAEALSVSRISVRQAVKVLENMGVVTSRRGSGTYVRELGVDSIVNVMLERFPIDDRMLRELIDARATIEQRVLALAFQRRRTADFKSVHAAMAAREERFRDVSDDEVGSNDVYFERALAGVCGNRVLVLLQAALHEFWILTWGRLGILPGEKHKLHEEHKRILRAIEDGDLKKASSLMARHLDRPVDRQRVAR